MRFVDLFAGLGGFHLALRKLGHGCVFASEIDETLRALYERNFSMAAAGDIRSIPAEAIPAHDILCAGFPCQPFSKAGSQMGLQDPKGGSLLYEILRIIKQHRPPYLFLENVPNFERHDDGRTWDKIEGLLRAEGYDIRHKKLSPHNFGIPQIRERIYIVGALSGLHTFDWPQQNFSPIKTSIYDILETNPADAHPIPVQVDRCLEIWQEFLDHIPQSERVPHPLWSMEFGATYPFEDSTPFSTPIRRLRRFKGSHGQPLTGHTQDELYEALPSHARTPQEKFPDWKVKFIRLNREFYARHRDWLDGWIPKISIFPSSFQKLEWNCQGDFPRIIERYVIQIRASGVRIKRPNTSPSLVAMTATQVPIIGWERRYITPNECKKLQSMDELPELPERHTKAYKALGNAINVNVAELVAKALLEGSIGDRGLLIPAQIGLSELGEPLVPARYRS